MPAKDAGVRQAYLADADIARWYREIARGAPTTADNYLRILTRTLARYAQSPKGLLQLKPRQREDFVADTVDKELARGLAPSSVAFGKKAIASWLYWNGKPLARRIRIKGASDTPSLRNEYIPSPAELRQVLDVADVRARTAICLMAHSGMRPEVLGNYRGTNGLRLGDFSDLDLEGETISFRRTPAVVQVAPELSKTSRSYLTMLGPEGCSYLVAYLQERRAGGEKLTKASAVITPRVRAGRDFIRTINIGDLVRKPMRAAGIKLRPYIWRSYFDHHAMQAERHGLLRDYREHFMGHKGDIEHTYTLHKRVPAATLERMRTAYEAACRYLETRRDAEVEDPLKRIATLYLRAANVSDAEIAGLDWDGMDSERLEGLVLDAMRKSAPVPAPAPSAIQRRQRVVAAADLGRFLEDGWTYRAALDGGQVVIEASP